MSGRQWSPMDLNIILHHYVTTEPFPNRSTTYAEKVITLVKSGLLKRTDGDVPELTEMGFHFVELLLSTPRPKLVFIDPNTGKAITTEAHDIEDATR
jgi:hypothetical protein